MKTNLRKLVTGASGVAALALLGAGLFGVSDASAGIANTKHNLGSSAMDGTGTRVNSFSGTAEICVFCHTPHGSDTSAAVPLWNRKLAEPTTYTTYNSLGTSSLDGATAQVGSVSLACLSCHDGTQAMNVMINAPGSGGYTAGGAAYTGLDGSGVAGAWSGANQSGGKIAAGLITMIGQDLKNDHPVGIQYAGGPDGAIPAAGTDYTAFKDKDFKPAKSDTLNNMSVWWVDTGTTGAGSRQKTDMQLYTRTDAVSATSGTLSGAQPYVECASCHDPHTDAAPTFLRISNAGSAVCLACHIK